MKSMSFLIMIFFSFMMFSLEKSGIKEYDQLNLSKGKIIGYYDKNYSLTEDKTLAMYYRKVFSENKGLYLVVDFYTQSDTPQFIYKTMDPEDRGKILGKAVYYDLFGNILYVADMKNGMFNGKRKLYENGKVIFETEFLDNKMNGTGFKYLNGKKVFQAEYVDEKMDGDVIIYNSDGTVSIIETFEMGKLLSVKVKNHNLQKTGIPEYDNLDIKENKIFIYYDMDKKITSNTSDRVFFYRKILKEENGVFLVADFLMYSDNILGISKVRNPKDKYGITNEGYSVEYCESGYLISKAFYKNGKLDGEEILYDNFGNPKTINTYKDGKLINTEYLGSN